MDVGMNRARQHLTFNITSDGYVVGRVLRMGDAGKVLFNDRAFVEVGRHVMGGGSDQFHTTLIGLTIWVRTLKAWQE